MLWILCQPFGIEFCIYARSVALPINKLATLSDFTASSVKNILYGRSQDPKILTIKKICDGLDITLIDFFNSPEFASLEPEIK